MPESNFFERFVSWYSQLFSSVPVETMVLILFPIAIWSVVWQIIALWKAYTLRHWNWLIVLLLVNAFGILQIIYIYKVARKSERT